VKEYYDTRAPEYDEWYLGRGLFARRDRPGWDEALSGLIRALGALAPVRTLDVACGTGFLTRHLPGTITGLDQSERMLSIASDQVPGATFVNGDALALPFDDGSFERVCTAHFYGHLQPFERERFLGEARRVGDELIVVDSAVRPDHDREERQRRVLNDGAEFSVFKRYFDSGQLLAELGGGEVLHESRWFVAIRHRQAASSVSAL
jgi:ubiquinone/menaquinone biosynthesis C-methylase UbiE